MNKIKCVEDTVLAVLKRNKRARCDDFVLYGSVLKELGIDLQATTLYDFLATAKSSGMPSFETCTRCRRHIQELMPELKDDKVSIKREEMVEKFKQYNLSDIGGKYE